MIGVLDFDESDSDGTPRTMSWYISFHAYLLGGQMRILSTGTDFRTVLVSGMD